MEEATKESLRTWAPIGSLLLTAGIFVLALIPYFRGTPVSTLTSAALAVLVVANLSFIFGSMGLRRTRGAMPPPEGSKPAPADIVRELLALIAVSKRVWSANANFADSFGLAGQSVINNLSQKMRDPKDPNRIFLEQAQSILNTARTMMPLSQSVTNFLDALPDPNGVDEGGLLVALACLNDAALAGSNTANLLSQSVRNGGVALDAYVRDEWNGFADKVNRFSDDLSKLGEKYKSISGQDPKIYIPRVRAL